MSINYNFLKDYETEVKLAMDFIHKHQTDSCYIRTIAQVKSLREQGRTLHSDYWSEAYDMIKKYYPTENSQIITGLSYIWEDRYN